MSSTKFVAFILGHIGFAVAAQLRENDYRVALGSRNPKPTSDNDAYLNVKVDVQKRESIEEAFDTVVHQLGPVNVVIYNGISVFLLDKKYVWLTLPVSCFCHCTRHPTTSQLQSTHTMMLPQLAWVTVYSLRLRKPSPVSGTRSIRASQYPKAFIVTGNILPFGQYSPPGYHTLGLQKGLAN